jgi:hypothetical protein
MPRGSPLWPSGRRHAELPLRCKAATARMPRPPIGGCRRLAAWTYGPAPGPSAWARRSSSVKKRLSGVGARRQALTSSGMRKRRRSASASGSWTSRAGAAARCRTPIGRVAPVYPDRMDADVSMFRPMPSVGLGRRWHVFGQRLHGFALVAPQPCGFVQAEIHSARRPPRAAPSSRRSTRLISRASAPEFSELLGEGSALVVTGSSNGRTQRQIHRIRAEHVLGVAVREDRFDSAAACA